MTTRRIAMWSGPRNISTAMMRAWENRPDCTVIDEPLYAHYLAATGADHPGRDEVIAAGETDWRTVVSTLLGPVPGGKPLWYQKHMCHHLLPGMAIDWIDALDNILLVRDPRQVVASYLRARETVTPEDIGVPQQEALFEHLRARTGDDPIVIDSGAFLAAPEAHLRQLCERLGLDFDPRMLRWPQGPRDTDGVWAPHWYASVWASTGFEPAREHPPELDAHAESVAARCMPAYERMRAASLHT
ncbi:MAG: hypothetical protein KDJ14_10435 [Xanthomonadales bacterium]|nr:hypothetical protein [Xanthomonadales bacterium]